MKRIILTESQYKRLVRQPLNESGRGDIIFENPEDEKDVDADITWLLVYLRNQLYELHQKNVFVKRIEGGKVYLDATKYTDKEVETINYLFSKFSEWKQGYKDQIVGLPKDLTFDIGHDTDYVFNVDTDDDDVVDTDDDDVVDTDDVANVEYDIDKTYSRGEYINLVKNIAIQQMEKYKIPASVTIAQAILESGDGNSDLAKKGKNHFGVKCHGWSGDKSYHDDDKPNECFRNYDNISDSFEDHSKFLKDNDRYNTLFDLDITDYKGWSQGLESAGYATSSKYAETLISIIERDNLFEYDVNNESSNDVIANVEISGGGSIDLRNKIVTKSESRLGEPYEIGDEFDEVGGDCSGLIDWVLRNTDGIDSPYNGRETSANLKTLVKPSNKKKKIGLNKGDILVFNKLKGEKYGHVGFVHKVTDGKVDMIHSSGSKGVNITKDIFNNSFWSGSRYYGAIPIVDGKYESN
tara:strand:+ start:8 stop:1405 length:1398 start_codon:yes stop_codon:yes gene_type:complete